MVNTPEQARRRLLTALTDDTRRQIVESLAERPRTAGEIHRMFPIAAPAVSRHLRVLREAGLVAERRGEDRRVRVYHLETEPLSNLSHWLDEVSRTWQLQLDSFKEYVALRTSSSRDAS